MFMKSADTKNVCLRMQTYIFAFARCANVFLFLGVYA